jgi:sugar O-acyltransferase (sialic acid O-acetyltransferase NeuD family)
MGIPVIVIGAGGHAKVLIDALLTIGIEVLGATDMDPVRLDSSICGLRVLGDDNILVRYAPQAVRLVNGLGSVAVTTARQRIYEKYKGLGYSFETIIHPSAVVSKDVELSEGVQVMAGAIIQAGSRIGQNTIINTGATVDHDCEIGAHVHLAPGAILSGSVKVGSGTHIGTGAVVIQNILVGHNDIIGAGSVVVENIADCRKVIGVPAREWSS